MTEEQQIKLSVLNDIFTMLKNKDGEPKFVGGAVRDFLLENPEILKKFRKVWSCEVKAKFTENIFFEYCIKNNKDIDITTTLLPNKVQSLFAQKGYTAKTTLATNIIVKHGLKTEITTLRNDYEQDGRQTKISYSTDIRDDSRRRDFTINAIYLDFTILEDKSYDFRLYDLQSGIACLKAKIVKFIGFPKDRIQEDYLRLLRFFRFTARFAIKPNHEGFRFCKILAPDFAKACLPNAQGDVILAKERVRDEILQIININGGLKLLQQASDKGFLHILLRAPSQEDVAIGMQKTQQIKTLDTNIDSIILLLTICGLDATKKLIPITNADYIIINNYIKIKHYAFCDFNFNSQKSKCKADTNLSIKTKLLHLVIKKDRQSICKGLLLLFGLDCNLKSFDMFSQFYNFIKDANIDHIEKVTFDSLTKHQKYLKKYFQVSHSFAKNIEELKGPAISEAIDFVQLEIIKKSLI
jgi:tRNA nucleotidyltransferase/poly(A) polymerase